ncbi:MAG: GldG family protein [Polyangiaceae bacterium]|nr:GldG family protein [Polyangiaceae bacterium]
MERKTRAATFSGVFLLVVAGIVVFANVLSFGAYKRFDVTKNERFTLSQGSARLVREGLKQELQIDVYVTRGLPKYEAFITDLTDLLDEYQRAGNGKVKYTVIEPKTDEQRQAPKDAGLQQAMFGNPSATCEDQATISRGYMGMAFKYGSEKEAIPILSPDAAQGLEFWITNKIREIRDRADEISQKIGILVGKDEIKLTEANLIPSQPGRGNGPNMRGILEQALPFYKFEDVDLKGGDEEVNKELKGLIITQPGKEFTEKELRRIDQFVMLGDKALVVLAGAVNLKASDATMKATLNTWGLEKLLDGYGVEMKKEAILDWGQSMRIPFQTQGGIEWRFLHGMVQAQHDDGLEEKEQTLDTSYTPFFRMDEISFPFPSTLVAHPDKQPEAKLKVVARSSPNTTVDATENIDLKFTNKIAAKGEYGQRAMAIALEGKIKSAFAGGDNQGIAANATAPTDSRVLVVSAAQFLANPLARSGNPPPMPPQMMMMGGMGGDEDLQTLAQMYAQKYLTVTILVFKNTLDWAMNDATLVAASAKLAGDTNLTYADIRKPAAEASQDPAAIAKQQEDIKNQRKTVQQRVQWTLTLVPALIFLALGLVLWQLRERSREAISLD